MIRATITHTGRLAFVLTCCLVVIACQGRSTTTSLAPNLSSIQGGVFSVHCAVDSCHRGPMPESQLNLEPGQSYANLVNVRSIGLRGLFRVHPGRADSSYLVRKLTGDGIVGDRMPYTREPLPDSVINVIRAWIDSGAPQR